MDEDEDFHAARGATLAQAAADGALFAERLAKASKGKETGRGGSGVKSVKEFFLMVVLDVFKFFFVFEDFLVVCSAFLVVFRGF